MSEEPDAQVAERVLPDSSGHVRLEKRDALDSDERQNVKHGQHTEPLCHAYLEVMVHNPLQEKRVDEFQDAPHRN